MDQGNDEKEKFLCYRASCSLRYSQDTSTSRCRISYTLQQRYQLSINSIIYMKVFINNSQFFVLCTVFPYNNYEENHSNENKIMIDDSVVKGIRIQWTSGYCEVLCDERRFSY